MADKHRSTASPLDPARARRATLKRWGIRSIVWLAAFMAGVVIGALPEPIGGPSPALGLDPFYTKYLDAGGIPIVSSSSVSDAALYRARETVLLMISKRRDVLAAMMRTGTRVGIMSEDEVTTDIPEYRDLPPSHPWAQARGVGATKDRPISICGEENILRFVSDPNRGEDILIHEFAHAMDFTGLRVLNPLFGQRLHQVYTNAMRLGRWKDTYASVYKEEYWTEGVQSYFDANGQSEPPNGTHNHINTRQELRVYDPELYALIREVFPVELTPLERGTRLVLESSGSEIRLVWPTQPSVVYEIQASADLEHWSYVGDPQIGTTNMNPIILPQPTSPGNNFFRLLLQ